MRRRRAQSDRRPKNLLSVFGFPCAMIDDFCRLARSVASRHRKVGPSSSSSSSVRGRFRKEGRFLKLVACGHDDATDGDGGGREEVPHTNRTHARSHGHRRQNRERRERASERERARNIRPRRCTWRPTDRPTDERPPAQVTRLLLPLLPDALQSVRQSCPDGVRRETSTCGGGRLRERLCIAAFGECRLPRSFPLFHSAPTFVAVVETDSFPILIRQKSDL